MGDFKIEMEYEKLTTFSTILHSLSKVKGIYTDRKVSNLSTNLKQLTMELNLIFNDPNHYPSTAHDQSNDGAS